MAITFHIDPNDGPRRCSRAEQCDWAGPDEHYPSDKAVSAAYDAIMAPFAWMRSRKVQSSYPTAGAAQAARARLRREGRWVSIDRHDPKTLWLHEQGPVKPNRV